MSVSLHISDRNHWRVLTLAGRVDAFADKRILSNVRQAIPNLKSQVVLDLKACDFLSLFALKSLGDWAQELKIAGGQLLVMGPNESLRRQLDVFLGRSMEIATTWEDLEIQAFYQMVTDKKSRAMEEAEARMHEAPKRRPQPTPHF
jgi:anti-anti-sigma factor